MLPGLLLLVLQATDVPPSCEPATAPADSASEYARVLAEGDSRHAAFDYERAREAYETALALAADANEVRLRLAHVLNDLGEAAVAQSERLQEAGQDGRGRSRAEEAERLFERARGLARGLRESWPERAEGFYWNAASLANLTPFRSGPDKVKLARELDADLRRAIELDPCFAPAWAALGVASREIGRLGWFVRGVARATLGGLPAGSVEEAEGLLRGAAALDPEDPFPLYQLALTLEARERTDEAVEALEQSLALPDREARDRRNRRDAEVRLRRLRGNLARRRR